MHTTSIKRNILVTGAGGQLGRHLLRTLTPLGEVMGVGHGDMDITDPDAVRAMLNGGAFTHVVNCAAYTAVDRAETERDAAYRTNALGPENLAEACKASGVKLIHISTDFVFDGSKREPYTEADQPNPLSVYGASKLEGEQKVIAANPDAVIIRTGWLYSEEGHNFVRTIARNMLMGKALRVVNDQKGTPTYAADLADAIARIVASEAWLPGIYHYANIGTATWYDFACAIRDHVAPEGTITPCSTAEYPTPATRPTYSVLDKSKITRTFNLAIPDWRASLARCLVALDVNSL